MSDATVTWNKVCAYMQKHCAVVLRADQAYLLEARLTTTAKVHKFTTIAGFVDAAITAPPSTPYANALIDAMTTHESYFFRDESFWRFLEQEILPNLIKGTKQGLKVWSAACSTGQEAYSLAMLLEERWPEVASKSVIKATDISAESVATATQGTYTTTEVNRGLSALRLIKNFQQVPGGFRLKDALRQRVQFSVTNLMASTMAPREFDLILCRNVLIYFSDADKKFVLQKLIGCLQPQGYLGLGTSERCELPALQPGWHQKPQ